MVKTTLIVAALFFFIGLSWTGNSFANETTGRPNKIPTIMATELADCIDLNFFTRSDKDCICCNGEECPQGNKCSGCPEGHFINGTVSEDGKSKRLLYCRSCKKGYYQSQKGMKECLKCPPGYETVSEGSTLCVACSSGFYKNMSMDSCQPCPAGWEAVKKASTSCTPCFEGTYKTKEGPRLCEPCIQGYYILTKEALYCLQCPAGFYCPCSKCGPINCPDEAYCPLGSISPTYCSSPLYRWINDGCYVSTTLIGIIVASILFSFLLISVMVARIYFTSRRRSSSCSHLISVEDSCCSEPVYSGL